MTNSSISAWIYDLQFEVPSFNYNFLICCVTAPVSVDWQVKKLMPSNFQQKVSSFTGHVKTEKLIFVKA